MPDFGSLFDNPVFTSGLSLLGGARERNPWMAAQQQMQQWQSLQQQGKYKKMQEQLLQIEADKAKQEAEKRQRAQAFAQSYNPDATMNEQLKLGVQSGAVDAGTAIMTQQKQAEAAAAAQVKIIDAAIAREDNQAAKKELQDDRLKVEERMKADTLANQRLLAQMTHSIGQGNRTILDQLRQAQIADLQSKAGERRDAVDAKEQAKVDASTERFSNQLAQHGVPPVLASVQQLNETLAKYDPKNVPGIGYAKNLPTASFFLTEEGKKVKSQAQTVSNDVMKMLSGLAVTLPEGERRALEQMSSGQFDAKDFYNAWPNIVNRVNSTIGNLKAGYGPKVTEQYTARPGALPLQEIKPTKGRTKDKEGLVVPGGVDDSELFKKYGIK